MDANAATSIPSSRTPGPGTLRENPKHLKLMGIFLLIFSAPVLYSLLWFPINLVQEPMYALEGLLRGWLFYLLRGAVLVHGAFVLYTLWGKSSRYVMLPRANLGNLHLGIAAFITAIAWYFGGSMGTVATMSLIYRFGMDESALESPLIGSVFAVIPFIIHYLLTLAFAPRIVVVDLQKKTIEKSFFFWPTAFLGKSMPLSSVTQISTTRRWVRTSRSAGYVYELVVAGAKRWILSFVPSPLMSIELDELDANGVVKMGERADKL